MPSGSVITMKPALISLAGLEAAQPGGAQGDQAVRLRLEGRHPRIALEARRRPDVEVHAVLGRLALGHPLEEQPRTMPSTGKAADRELRCSGGTPTLSRKASHVSKPGGGGCSW